MYSMANLDAPSPLLPAKLDPTTYTIELPSEVLSKIFMICRQNFDCDEHGFAIPDKGHWTAINPYGVLWTITRVSRYWRDVAIRYPALWCSIWIDASEKHKFNLELLRIQLQRSQSDSESGVPLRIILYVDEWREMGPERLGHAMKLLSPRFHQIIGLSLDLDFCSVISFASIMAFHTSPSEEILPALHTLEFRCPTGIPPNNPLLSTFKNCPIRTVVLPSHGYLDILQIPLAGITHLEDLDHQGYAGRNYSLHTFTNLLWEMQNVETVNVPHTEWQSKHDHEITPLPLPHLRRLSMTFDYPENLPLISDALEVPALEDLQLQSFFSSSSSSSAIIKMIHRSKCTLKRLHLSFWHGKDFEDENTSWTSICEHTSDLETLILDSPRSTIDGIVSLPKLRRLKIVQDNRLDEKMMNKLKLKSRFPALVAACIGPGNRGYMRRWPGGEETPSAVW